MNSEEYANLERIERGHWYYSGKRQFVREWILRARPPAPGDRLLDCGAGTGLFAQEMAAHCGIWVLDDHEEALRILRTRFSADQIIGLKEGRIPLPDASVETVTALDVLEHVPDDAAVVGDFCRLLKPGGLVVVTVPAGMELWSDWDISLHHHRRYTRRGLTSLFAGGDWEIIHVNYTNVVVYPAVWCVRKWRGLRHKFGWPVSIARTEDRLPPGWLNDLLRAVFVRMALTSMPMPFGVSLVLVARKPGRVPQYSDGRSKLG